MILVSNLFFRPYKRIFEKLNVYFMKTTSLGS